MKIICLILFILGLVFGIQECSERSLHPWCRAHGFDHGNYVAGYGGGSFCVDAKGQMTRVEGP